MPGAKERTGTGGTFLLLINFKLTWLGLASLREGPAAVPAYGGCSLTVYCTVNPVTVTGLSMPLPPHLCEAKRKQGCGGWERKFVAQHLVVTNKQERGSETGRLTSIGLGGGGLSRGGLYISSPSFITPPPARVLCLLAPPIPGAPVYPPPAPRCGAGDHYTGYGPVPNPAVRAGGSMLGYSEGGRILARAPSRFYIGHMPDTKERTGTGGYFSFT